MNRILASTMVSKGCDHVNYPLLVVSFCNLRPCDLGARVIYQHNWRGGIQEVVNQQQGLGNPGCVMEWQDGAYYIVQSW